MLKDVVEIVAVVMLVVMVVMVVVFFGRGRAGSIVCNRGLPFGSSLTELL